MIVEFNVSNANPGKKGAFINAVNGDEDSEVFIELVEQMLEQFKSAATRLIRDFAKEKGYEINDQIVAGLMKEVPLGAVLAELRKDPNTTAMKPILTHVIGKA